MPTARYGEASQAFMAAADGAAQVSKPGPDTTPWAAAGGTAAGSGASPARTPLARTGPLTRTEALIWRAVAGSAPYDTLTSIPAAGMTSMISCVTAVSGLVNAARPCSVTG